MTTRTRPRSVCSGCGRRIPRSEPDIILRPMTPENPTRTALRLVYHERCHAAALERVQGVESALWRMTHRYVEAAAN